MANIYALLAGINVYAAPGIPELRGPERDVQKINDYLSSLKVPGNRDVFIETLKGPQATHQQILDTWKRHFGNATAGDEAVFFFSGHGALETAHDAFTRPGQQFFESLVCYDTMAGGAALADKELRFLIHQLSQRGLYVTCILDCCHSGGATREMRNNEKILKKLSKEIPMRQWKDFVFSGSIQEDEIRKAKDFSKILPEGKHVQLSACQSSQSAWEVRGSAIFTANLLQVLQQSGTNLSYADLFSRVKYLVVNRFDQVPHFYTPAKDKIAESSRLFLGGQTGTASSGNANIVFNSADQCWLLSKGAIHGIGEASENYQLPVYLSAPETPLTYARIIAVLPDHCRVEMKDPAIEKKSYRTIISNLYQKTLNITVIGARKEEPGITSLLNEYNHRKELYNQEGVVLSGNDMAGADYLIVAADNSYHIVRPNDSIDPSALKSILRKSSGYTALSVKSLLTWFISISRWEFVKTINNPASSTRVFPMSVEFYFSGQKDAVEPDADGMVSTTYDKAIISGIETAEKSVKINIKNNSEITWYLATLYLGIDFSIKTDLIPEEVVQVKAADTVYLQDGQELEYGQEKFTRAYNLEYETPYLLLIVSSTRFEIGDLTQEGLPLPETEPLSQNRGGPRETWRPLTQRSSALPLTDWCTKLVTLKLKNPFYTDESKKNLSNMNNTKLLLRMKSMSKDIGQENVISTSNTDPIKIAETDSGDLKPWDMAHQAYQDDSDISFAEPEVGSSENYYPVPLDIEKAAAAAKGLLAKEEYDKFMDYWPRPSPNAIWHLGDNFSQLKAAREDVKALSDKKVIRIAHFDTGYDPTHISYPEKLIRKDLQRNFVDGEEDRMHDASDSFNKGLVKMPGHGTGTLSILAGAKVAIPHCQFDDYLGLYDSVEIVPIRISKSVVLLKSGAFVRAMDYVVNNLHKNENTKIHIITMSMGGLASRAWADMVNEAYDKGIFIVTAAGNNYNKLPTRTLIYPARFKRVVSACGVTYDYSPYHKEGSEAGFDLMEGNYGPNALMKTAIAAFTPNVPWATYRFQEVVGIRGDGTSSATPQIAAAAALYCIKYHKELEALPEPWMKVEAIRNALFESASKQITGYDGDYFKFYGNGFLQAKKMLDVKVPAATALTREEEDTVSFPFFRLILRTANLVDESAEKNDMLETELMQLLLSNQDLQQLLNNEEKDIEDMSDDELRAFIDAVLANKEASDTLKLNMAELKRVLQ